MVQTVIPKKACRSKLRNSPAVGTALESDVSNGQVSIAYTRSPAWLSASFFIVPHECLRMWKWYRAPIASNVE